MLVHIIAVTLALLFGYTAMFAAKGGPLHRRAGRWFVLSMLCMGGAAPHATPRPQNSGARTSSRFRRADGFRFR